VNNKYLGVYFTVVAKTTSGAEYSNKRYWYVWEWDTGTVLLINANEKMQPQGQPRILVYAVFDSRFSRDETKSNNLPEPPVPHLDVLSQPQKPAPVSPKEELETAQYKEEHDVEEKPKPQNYYSHEELKLAENDARSSFTNGLDQYQKGQRNEAMQSFERPLIIAAPWERKHKHMFSDFGITLRKIKITELALQYHSKALGLAPNEPNIMFNLARAHLTLGDFNSARSCLNAVLAQKPNLKEAVALKEFIDKTR
jgi:Flp pilus assembly protein TadD, contains TPR repeats